MTVQKQTINVNFAQGLDTKTDPKQVTLGKMLALSNSVFQKGRLLQKRNGYGSLPSLPNTSSTYATTFNGDLTAIGDRLQAFSSGYNQWSDRGFIQSVEMGVIPLIRNNTSQTQVDTAVAPNGLICTVYTDQDPSNLSAAVYKYVVADSTTGQNIISPTVISQADASYGTPRVFLLGNFFIVVFTNKVSTVYHLKYFAISITNATNVTSPVDLSASYTPASTLAFDGVVFNNKLYLAWNGASSSGIKMLYITSTLSTSAVVDRDASHEATLVNLVADEVRGTIWVMYYDSGTTNAYALAVDAVLNSLLGATQIITSETVLNMTGTAQNGTLTFYYEVDHAYSYDSMIPSHFLKTNTVTQAGSVGTASVFIRSVGLASKAFLIGTIPYFLSVYQSPYQSTYFLLNGSAQILAKLAYGNTQGYLTLGLPSVTLFNGVAQIGYLFKDLIQSVNKNTNVPSGNQTAGVYAQTGLNLAQLGLTSAPVISAEIGNNLNLSGGFLWGYDGYAATEQEFFLYPDSIDIETSTSDGFLTAQTYFYQVTYEWSDNQGNLFRSAPSIPVSITTTGSTSSNTLHIPTLRLTYKTANPVKIVIYRWSTAQQIYYQVTSITTPILNSTTIDSVDFVDTLVDSDILGNNILYTNGGVLENIGPPSFASVFIFDNRLFGITSEDKNLLWYSKQVLDATPVEMSDLLTYYVAPNIGAQGPTGSLLCGSQMDDKAILFKATAINYIAGTGPDATGANNQYTQPIFVTSTVGCSNQKSIVFQPQGLMFEFQSEAGNQIWILKRDLTTEYIGADVEDFTTNATVQSAVNIPGTNEVRFTLSSGITLMYDYYYGQWGTFTNIPATSSTLYQGLHTYINSFGQVFQETPGIYLDGSSPVLMSFTTSWIQIAGLQGYERAYFFTFLGTYYTPHRLNILVNYDYNPNSSSQTIFTPDNFSPSYGVGTYGVNSPYAGSTNIEKARVFFKNQRCQSFQIVVQEVYDSSYGVMAGKGLTLSGLALVVGAKRGYYTYRADQSVGAT